MDSPKLLVSINLRLSAMLFAATLVAHSTVGVAEQSACSDPPAPKGAWTQQGGAAQFLFEADRVVVRQDGQLHAAAILSREPCRLVVRDQGLRSTWTLAGDDRALQLNEGKGVLSLVPLPGVPASLDINPFPLSPLRPIPAETVKEISQELTKREGRDQDAYKKVEERSKRAGIIAENGRYLREVVGRYGWIDIPRFGKAAAAAAILIVKHADDVPLMQAALPIVEKDAIENGGGKELVSILVDEVLITTGHKQKYGTQIAEDREGKPFVVPVEDLAKVEEYRKTLGILSWSDYLKRASDFFYNGAPIRLPGPNE